MYYLPPKKDEDVYIAGVDPVDPFDIYSNIHKIFAPELLPKPSWSDAEIAYKWSLYASKFPKIVVDEKLPKNVFYMHDGITVHKVSFRYKDDEKKEIIVEKVK